ncbi:MAG: CBS domain-containing protein [Planctomycetes bacterium]|nr:CBS domain-containing protein [Planctomycetota bacterium]
MGEQDVSDSLDDRKLQTFMRALLADVSALESMLDSDVFESGIRRIGAEQEMFIVDRAGRPSCKSVPILKRLEGGPYTTELAQFNLEANMSPYVFGGTCLAQMEAEIRRAVQLARDAAESEHAQIALCGILPTMKLEYLGLDSMTPNPRYLSLNNQMMALRNGKLNFRIKGLDELDASHDNVMLESCNTSFQVHFQVAAAEFADLYNLAQAITAPVLAPAVNSVVLLGRRLWHETRVALFQQSVDARSDSHQARGLRPRVSFGDGWVERSVLEIFREDIARFRVVLASEVDEDPAKVLARGEMPQLSALRLHNGTVYRWNRPCYGVQDNVAHLRIENRVLPAGPTVVDEMANATFFFGLMSALSEEYGDISKVMTFDHAKDNFFQAARYGLRAQFTWLGGKEHTAASLILDHLLPLARQGLSSQDIDSGDIDRYIGIIEERVRSNRTGAQWALDSLASMGSSGTPDQRFRSLVLSTIEQQASNQPIHEWELARLNEQASWRQSYLQVGNFMTTDLFTVHPEDVVDLAASLMDWRHIRHVPVENKDGDLVGLVSHRAMLRLVGRGVANGGNESRNVSVADIMKRDPVTVSPDTPTLVAIETMRAHKVGCLPVVENKKLVGIITERDLVHVAANLLEKHLRESSAGE